MADKDIIIAELKLKLEKLSSENVSLGIADEDDDTKLKWEEVVETVMQQQQVDIKTRSYKYRIASKHIPILGSIATCVSFGR